MNKACEACGAEMTKPYKYSARQWAAARFCCRTCAAGVIHVDPAGTSRFFENFIPEPNSGCWLWTGTTHADGYGQISINGSLYRAHRLSFILHRGEIPQGLGILHRCDVRCCVNPDHLYVGTPSDNSRDMVDRRRMPAGSDNHAAKLSAEVVASIRESTQSHADLAREHGVSRAAIRLIRNRVNWKYAP